MKKQIDYVSDATRFVRELLAERPHLAEEQRKARARWWDRQPGTALDPSLDPDLGPAGRDKVAQSRVRQQPYVYQTKG